MNKIDVKTTIKKLNDWSSLINYLKVEIVNTFSSFLLET